MFELLIEICAVLGSRFQDESNIGHSLRWQVLGGRDWISFQFSKMNSFLTYTNSAIYCSIMHEIYHERPQLDTLITHI